MPRPPKIELPSDLGSAFVPPEGSSIEDLTSMIGQVRDAGIKLLDDAKAGTPGERIAKANWFAEAAKAMEQRQDELAATSAEEAQNLEAARAALAPKASEANPDDPNAPKEGESGGDGEGDDDPEAKAKAAQDAQAAAQAAQVATTGDPSSTTATEPMLVAGGGSRPSAVAAAAGAGAGSKPSAVRPRPKPKGEAYLTAGAGVADFEAGQRVDFDGMGRIGSNRFGHLMGIGDRGPRTVLPLGRIHVPTLDERLVAAGASRGEFVDINDAIAWAVSPERLRKETGATGTDDEMLVAAGGWCAPSETLYDLVNLMTRDGMLDVPSITVNRGGVRFSLGPDFTQVYNAGANFTHTEAQAISGTAKPVVNIPCPSFTDNRMLVDGLYLTGDILSQKGYPEAYADFIEKAMIAFAHYVNANSIADQATGSTLVDYVGGTPPAGVSVSVTSTLLGTIELQATDMRYKNRLALTAPLEAVLPVWAKGALRSDMAKRLGVENTQGITDADLESFLAVRGIRVQWVYDWQDAFTTGSFGGATALKTWPTSVQFLLYPAGTWVRALSDVIELQAVYDSVLLTTNQFVALFTEQGRLSLKRAWDSRLVKIPVAVTGATALGIDYTTQQPTV